MKKRNVQRKRQQRNIWAMVKIKPELEVLEDADIPPNVIVINQEVKK